MDQATDEMSSVRRGGESARSCGSRGRSRAVDVDINHISSAQLCRRRPRFLVVDSYYINSPRASTFQQQLLLCDGAILTLFPCGLGLREIKKFSSRQAAGRGEGTRVCVCVRARTYSVSSKEPKNMNKISKKYKKFSFYTYIFQLGGYAGAAAAVRVHSPQHSTRTSSP